MKPFNIVLELLKSGGDCILFKGTKKKILLLIYGSASLASAPELGSGEESWPLSNAVRSFSSVFLSILGSREQGEGHGGNHKCKFAKIS